MASRSTSAGRHQVRVGRRRVVIGVTSIAAIVSGVGVWAAAADSAQDSGRTDAEQQWVGELESSPSVPRPDGDASAAAHPPNEGSGGRDSAGVASSRIESSAKDGVGAPADDVAEAPPNSAAVESLIEAALEVTAGGQVMSDTELREAVDVDLPSLAAGPIRAELEAELLEVQTHGWTRQGSPSFSEIQILDDQSIDGEQLVVSVCVDWSKVTYIELDGSLVPPNPTPRARNIFTLQPGDDGRWMINHRDFPNDPRC